MGSYTSKSYAHHNETDNKSKLQTLNISENSGQLQNTPTSTRTCLSVDPRSATIGIVRTPIQVYSTPTGVCKRTTSAIPKHLKMRPYLETDIDSVMDTLTLHRQISDPRSPNVTCERTPIIIKTIRGYSNCAGTRHGIPEVDLSKNSSDSTDPRSPAIYFDRTPIMKLKSSENIDKISPKNVRQCLVEPSNLPMLYCETTIDCIIPEVQSLPRFFCDELLSSDKNLCPCNDTIVENSFKRRSNIDLSIGEHVSEEHIAVLPNVNVLKNYSQALNIHDIVDDELEKESTDANDRIYRDMIARPIGNLERNETIIGKLHVWQDNTSSECSKTEVFKAPEETIIEFDDEKCVATSHMKSDAVLGKINRNKLRDGMLTGKKKKSENGNHDIKLSCHGVKEYNADGTIIDTQRNRMPLGNRSNNHQPVILTKSPQQFVKNKVLSTISQQQENTPPRIKRGKARSKSNTTQWDLDRTIVI